MKRNYTPKFWEWSQSQNRKGYINMKFKIVQVNIVVSDGTLRERRYPQIVEVFFPDNNR